ncbi:hypothetical protein BofuT4_P100360.1 [Botrytis cinerea T4]|uniref:Uncharacterized protein n=1 Tax=Botryotinia fuckeliana (strain T4) TaxID=999810 RepID=G2YBP1_BOTF4|nr:hypothetical protein BofuT4_P100360.1 [Botrytis cinerea T4]
MIKSSSIHNTRSNTSSHTLYTLLRDSQVKSLSNVTATIGDSFPDTIGASFISRKKHDALSKDIDASAGGDVS